MAHDASSNARPAEAQELNGPHRLHAMCGGKWCRGWLQRMYFTVNFIKLQTALHMAKYFLIFLDVGRQEIGKTNKFDSKQLHLT